MALVPNLITVQFRTTNDDKDADTLVICTLCPFIHGARGANVASLNGTLGYFDGNTLSPAYNMGFNLAGPWTSGGEYVFTIAIEPNGHDTWRFDCVLHFQFAGNIEKTYTFLGHALSQNVRSNEFYIVL